MQNKRPAVKKTPLIAEGFLAGGIVALVVAMAGSLAFNEMRFSFYVAAVAMAATLATGYLRFSTISSEPQV